MINKEYTYKEQGDGRDSWVVTEKEGDEIINSYMVYINPFINWRVLTEDLYKCAQFGKAIQLGNPNGITVFCKVLTDGEAGNSDNDTLNEALGLIGNIWNDADKAALIALWNKNGFTLTF